MYLTLTLSSKANVVQGRIWTCNFFDHKCSNRQAMLSPTIKLVWHCVWVWKWASVSLVHFPDTIPVDYQEFSAQHSYEQWTAPEMRKKICERMVDWERKVENWNGNTKAALSAREKVLFDKGSSLNLIYSIITVFTVVWGWLLLSEGGERGGNLMETVH